MKKAPIHYSHLHNLICVQRVSSRSISLSLSICLSDSHSHSLASSPSVHWLFFPIVLSKQPLYLHFLSSTVSFPSVYRCGCCYFCCSSYLHVDKIRYIGSGTSHSHPMFCLYIFWHQYSTTAYTHNKQQIKIQLQACSSW